MFNISPKDSFEVIKLIGNEVFKFLTVLLVYKRFQLFILIILMLLLIYLSYNYNSLNEQYQRIVVNTLYQESETTPQRFKGVESFILSYLDKTIDGQLKEKQFSPEFLTAFKELEDTIAHYDFSKKHNVKLDIVNSKSSETEILTDVTDTLKNTGFLFLPINILRQTLTLDQKTKVLKANVATNIEKQNLLNEIESDQNLMTEISFAQKLNKQLQSFTDKRVTKVTIGKLMDKPEQVYFITKSGINYIFSKTYNTFSKAKTYYGNQFPSTTFFPSRPYFWSVFVGDGHYAKRAEEIHLSSLASVKDSFYVSKPYMDLAGNGFIVTISRGIMIDGRILGVLCFDLPLISENSQSQKTTIQTVIDAIKKDIDIDDQDNVVATVNSGSLEINDNSPLATEFRNYTNALSPNELSDAIGNIRVFGDYQRQTITISLPVENTEYPKIKFLLIKIDIKKFQSKIFYTAVGALATVILLIFYLCYLYANTIKNFEVYEMAFNRVDAIMYKSPVPYCRLDGQDIIKDINPAFCLALGYNPLRVEHLTMLSKITFASLCVDGNNRATYQKVEDSRKQDELVEPYELNLKTADGKSKKFIIVSGQYPSTLKGKLPETFGILLDPENKTHHQFIYGYNFFKFGRSGD